MIRLLLAVAVIASHSYAIAIGLDAGERLEPLRRLTGQRMDVGSLAVDGFFALSGFLLAGSWLRGAGLGRFVARRFLRIYPGFFVCVVLLIVVFGPLGGAPLPDYFARPATYQLARYLYFGAFFNGLPGAFPTNPMPTIADSSLWTIKYEVFCYVIIVCLGVGRLLRPLPTLAATFLFLIGLTVIDWLNLNLPMALAAAYMPRLGTFFLAGASLQLWRKRVPITPWMFAIAAAVTAATVRLWVWPDVILPTLGMYCLFCLGCVKCPFTNAIGRRHDLSYGVYLYAWPVQQLLVHDGIGRGRPWILTAAAVPVTFLLATASWFLIERPALAIQPASFLRRTSAAGVPAPP